MKILLATDGSEFSEGAAKFLTRFNFSSHDEIIVLHAVSWEPVMSGWESLYVDLKKIKYEIVPKILDSAKDILKTSKAKISTSMVDGYSDKVIVDAAAGSDVDLVVMGARGLRGIGSLIVGSVTKLVAINSAKPVLIVKLPQQRVSEKMRILFATDGSACSDAAGEVLSSMPFAEDTEVTVLNAIFPALSDIPERFSMEINNRIKRAVADAREKEFKGSEKVIEKAGKQLSNKFSKIQKLTRMGDPTEEILKVAEDLKADIITVGSSGMRGIKGVLGSASRKILNHSRCSVLIAKS